MGFTMTPKGNLYLHFALGNTRLKMYGKGTKIDAIRESATIDASADISRPIVVNGFKLSEHV